MIMTLMGYKSLDFESNGERVKGTQAFVSYIEDGVIGQRTDKLFLRDGFPLPEIKPGDTLDVTYNRRGKPEGIRVVSNKQINLSR